MKQNKVDDGPEKDQQRDADAPFDQQTLPPSNDTRVTGAGAPQGQRETLVHDADTTRIDPPAARAKDATNPTRELDLNETGEFSADGLQAVNETQGMSGNEATGEFSFDAATRPDTARNTAKSTVRPPSSKKGKAPIPKYVGNYEIKRVLGRGGMGVVYLARQANLDRDVALKMVLSGGHASTSQLQRFQAEAKAVAKLQHPNIVQVFEVGQHEGLPYFSLEFVDGPSLDQRVDGKPLPPRDAALLLEKICRAMQYAHDRGILHRDLKPANILLAPDGEPKVTDFGLAKQLEDDDSASTRTGTIMGTPSYMSPEQAQGMISELTAATDQYSLGALLYELLTGRPPFLGTKALDTISQVVHKEPVPPCQFQEKLPVDIDTICLKALQKQPTKRYASCLEMAEDLGRFLRGEPILASPVSRFERVWRWCKRNPSIAVPSALATLLLIATAVISTWSSFVIADERDKANVQRALAVANEKQANEEKAEAEKQRLLAEESKLQAEKNQQLAENQAMLALKNIQLVVTEIDDRLAKEPGMSEIRIGMLEVLEKNWNDLDLALAGGIQGQAIPTVMAVRAKIADSWFGLDRLQEADAQYEVIYKQAQDRLLVKNRNDSSRFNLAILCVRRAPIRQRLTGDPAESTRLLEESESLLRDILADPRPGPESPPMYQVADVLIQSLMRSASAKLKTGELEEAKSTFGEIETVGQKVVDEIAQKAEWASSFSDERKALVESYFKQSVDSGRAGQANVLCRLGKADEAIPIFEQVIKGRMENVEQHPSDRNARAQLALQLRNYGQYMLRVGKNNDAVRLIGQSHDWAEKNYNDDPTSAEYKRSLGHSLYYWGVARHAAGQTSDSIVLFERSRVLRQEMVDTSADQANKVNLMLSEARLGNHEACQQLIEELAVSEGQNPDLRLDIARSYAQLLQQSTEDALRTRALEGSLASVERAIEEGLNDPFAISSEIDLSPLREEPRFIAMVDRLKNPKE